MRCRAQNITEKPFDIDIGFDNALGPVVLGTLKEFQASFENAGKQRKEYGEQRAGPKNEDIIEQATGNIKDLLNGYNTYALPKFDSTTINVDSTGTNQLRIGMMQDMGNINIKISATGDNCFGIKRGAKVISENICEKEAKEYYNPSDEEIVFSLVHKKTAGST